MSEIAELYPEHARMMELRADTEAVGQFIEWLESEGYVIAEWSDSETEHGDYFPVSRPPSSWIAQHFGLNPAKIEAEKRAMLAAMRGEGS